MTRWVCPRNGEVIEQCPTCSRAHRHKREELTGRKPKERPVCETHGIELVREERA